MHPLLARAGSGVAVLIALSTGAALAQESPEAGRPQKSVRGKLSSVDKSLNGVLMRSDDGQRLAWQFNARVIAEIAKEFKAGASMIVIYRQIAANEKRVTAVAFPGSADKPTYINTTGSRVLLRSTAFVDGECKPGGGPVSESMIPVDGVAEVLEDCWCCAVAGETCTPGNKSGQGRAFLVQCFK